MGITIDVNKTHALTCSLDTDNPKKTFIARTLSNSQKMSIATQCIEMKELGSSNPLKLCEIILDLWEKLIIDITGMSVEKGAGAFGPSVKKEWADTHLEFEVITDIVTQAISINTMSESSIKNSDGQSVGAN